MNKLVVLAAIICITGSAAFSQTESTALEGSSTCTPECRTGYICVDGKCIEKCNPPCPAGEQCDGAGNCVEIVQPNTATTDTTNDNAVTSVQCDTISKEKGKFFYKGKQLRTNPDFLAVLKTNKAAAEKYRSATGLGIVGGIISAVGGYLIGTELGNSIVAGSEREGNPGMYLGGGICVGVGMLIGVAAQNNARAAINDYNKAILSKQNSLNLTPDQIFVSQNGVTVGWNF